MNFLTFPQGSQEWFDARLGCVTSSRVSDAVSFLNRKSGEKKVGDETAKREKLRVAMVCEILTKKPAEHYVSRWMEEGKEKEPLARAAYSIMRDVYVEQIGFAFHPTIKMAGASPDGLVGNDGVVEFKCPKTETHIRYRLAGVIPTEYLPQCHWLIACCEREWLDFMSHDPSFKKEELRNFKPPRLYRDDAIIKDMETQVERFNQEVQAILLQLDPEHDPDYYFNKLKASVDQVKGRKQEDENNITDEDFKYLCPR